MNDPIPVAAARQIADESGHDIVVIVAWRRATNRSHVTTYGKNPMDKMGAAKLGEILAQAAGIGPPTQSFEDFRTRTAADWAQEKDALLRRIQELENGEN
jgi:hypothetical protein